MCAPIMAAFSIISAVAGTAMQMAGAQQQAKAQSDAAERQAEQYRAQAELQARQAVIQQTTAGYEQRKKGEQIDALQGRQRNMYGSTGLTIEGSPMDVGADTASEGALDIAAIQWNSTLKGQNQNFEAGISMRNSDASKKAASTARKTGALNAMSAAVSGIGSLAKQDFTSLGLKY